MLLHAGDSTVAIHLCDVWFYDSLETLSTNVAARTRQNKRADTKCTHWMVHLMVKTPQTSTNFDRTRRMRAQESRQTRKFNPFSA